MWVDLAALRRKEEKEANEAVRIRSTVNDIESAAFASYAKDLEQGVSKTEEKTRSVGRASSKADEKLHKVMDIPCLKLGDGIIGKAEIDVGCVTSMC